MKILRPLGLVLALGLIVGGIALAATPRTRPILHVSPEAFEGNLYIGPASANPAALKGILPFSATVDFTSAREGVAYSSAITVTGAEVGDSCAFGPTAAAAALLGNYGCVVTAANEVKAWFRPGSVISGTCTLGGESPSVCPAQTVTASSVCKCSPVGTTAAIAAAGCAVSLSSTTLTITSLNGGTHVINYECLAPVDPASGTFEGVVIKH